MRDFDWYLNLTSFLSSSSSGIVSGLAGMALKPTSGVLNFASKAVSGLRVIGDDTGRIAKQRIRLPRTLEYASQDEGGQLRDLRKWSELICALRSGRYRSDVIKDVICNRTHRALVLTNKRVIYINLRQKTLRWTVPLEVREENIVKLSKTT